QRIRLSVAQLIGKALLTGTLILLPLQLRAQDNTTGRRDTTKATPLTELSVTATRTPKPVFRTANPVIVVDSNRLRSSLANGIADLLREYPGLDLTGTG